MSDKGNFWCEDCGTAFIGEKSCKVCPLEKQLNAQAFSVRKPLTILLRSIEEGKPITEYSGTLVKEALRALKGRG